MPTSTKRLQLRQAVDAEQAEESLVRSGDSGPGAQPAADGAHPVRTEALEQIPPSSDPVPFFDLTEVVSYDEDPD